MSRPSSSSSSWYLQHAVAVHMVDSKCSAMSFAIMIMSLFILWKAKIFLSQSIYLYTCLCFSLPLKFSYNLLRYFGGKRQVIGTISSSLSLLVGLITKEKYIVLN